MKAIWYELLWLMMTWGVNLWLWAYNKLPRNHQLYAADTDFLRSIECWARSIMARDRSKGVEHQVGTFPGTAAMQHAIQVERARRVVR